jgi:hypothetical protein
VKITEFSAGASNGAPAKPTLLARLIALFSTGTPGKCRCGTEFETDPEDDRYAHICDKCLERRLSGITI